MLWPWLILPLSRVVDLRVGLGVTAVVDVEQHTKVPSLPQISLDLRRFDLNSSFVGSDVS